MIRVRPAVVLLVLVIAASVAAQTRNQFPELLPLPLGHRLAEAAEPLPLDAMVEAALVFSGIPEGSLDARRRSLDSLVGAFGIEVGHIRGQAALAQAALSFLHTRILRTYSFTQTRVDTALDTGVFNCVSASVLYMILARSVDLEVSGVKTSDHAFCSVVVDGRQVDVETTNPYGYDPGTRKEFTDSFGKVTGFSYVPQTNSRDRRAIGEKELLSLILYNRTSEEIVRGNYAEAVQPAATAYAVLGSEDSLKTLGISVLDYSSMLGRQRKYSEALTLLSEAKAMYGGSPELDAQHRSLLEGEIIGLVDAGSFDRARAVLSENEEVLDPARRAEITVYLIQKRAEAAGSGGDFSAAAAVIKDGLALYPRDVSLLRAFEAYVHNQFARLFNARRFLEAKEVLSSAREVYTDSAALAQDMRMVEKALSQ